MDFLSLQKKRYACRKYAPAKVEQEKLDIILEAGRVAPTGANRQPQRLIVVRSQEGMERLATLQPRLRRSLRRHRLRRHRRSMDPQIRR